MSIFDAYVWKFNKSIKKQLTNDANYQQQDWEKIADFGLTKKTRNSDSLTSEFHSGCKNYKFSKKRSSWEKF